MDRFKISKLFFDGEENYIVVDNETDKPVTERLRNRTQALKRLSELLNESKKEENTTIKDKVMASKKKEKQTTQEDLQEPLPLSFNEIAVSIIKIDGMFYIVKIPFNLEGNFGEMKKIQVGTNPIDAQERFKIVASDDIKAFLEPY